jgi:hypothetical protein
MFLLYSFYLFVKFSSRFLVSAFIFGMPTYLPSFSEFSIFLNLVRDFPWVFRIFSLRFVVWCCAPRCLLYYVTEFSNSLFDVFRCFERDVEFKMLPSLFGCRAVLASYVY